MTWVVLGLFAAWLTWYAVRVRRHQQRTGDPLGLALFRLFNSTYCRLWLGLCPNRRDPLPPTGAAILISNHTCSADPFLLTVATRRMISFMMAHEYLELPILPAIFHLVRVVTVLRDGRDLAGTKATLRALKHGHVVGVFPEGRINLDPGLLEPKLGAAMLAMKTGVPVIPAFITGTARGAGTAEAFLRPARRRVRIRYGPPVDLTPFHGRPRTRATLAAVSDHMMHALARLADVP